MDIEPKRIAKIDKNVSPNRKPVSGLAARKPGMRGLRSSAQAS
jgi:hypothetical protein